MSAPLLDISGLTMRYPNGHLALAGVDVAVAAGECVVVLGSNGSGKSTMLRCVVRMLAPTSGRIAVAGHDLAALSGSALRRARRSVALVSQRANLVQRRSALANVASGSLGRCTAWQSALGAMPADELAGAYRHLGTVGLAHLAEQRAGTLSGGQAQRVAIARALAQRPQVLLADEPVASLDPEAAEDVLRLLRTLAHDEGLAVVCVLHQPDLALRHADRIVGFRAGRVAFDRPVRECSNERIAVLYATEAA